MILNGGKMMPPSVVIEQGLQKCFLTIAHQKIVNSNKKHRPFFFFFFPLAYSHTHTYTDTAVRGSSGAHPKAML